MVDFKDMAARVKGMQAIEAELRSTSRRTGYAVKAADLAWNRNRPYDAVPDTLELSIRANGGTAVQQVFTRGEVEACAGGVHDATVTAKIETLVEHLRKLEGRKRDD